MRQFLRLLLLALVLITVFLASALTAMRLAIHGRETTVPNFVGLAPSQAERLASDNGLVLNRDDRFYSSTVPEGRILSQLPAAGERVRRGWRVRLAESMGPQRVTIPDVVGQSPRAAEINLTRRGLELGTVAVVHLPNLRAGQVLAQSPPANAEGIASPKVNILLTAPPDQKPQYYVMPDFLGRRFGDATGAMAEAGFRVGDVLVRTTNGQLAAPVNSGAANGNQSVPVSAQLSPIATDIITAQNPTPGQKVGTGASVSFELVRP